ncbi:MAG TPA: hypothetical protein V6C52_10145 [Coleofasciculaceae cyanobacterium]|jgi:hypothetical protein
MNISNGPKFGLNVHIRGGCCAAVQDALQALKGNVKVQSVQAHTLEDAYVTTGNLKDKLSLDARQLADMLWEDPYTPPEKKRVKDLLVQLFNA